MSKIYDMIEKRRAAPKGHFVVYVGEEEEYKRYVIPTSYLKNPIFQKLLEKAAEEFGFHSHKGIVLPCDESTFQEVIGFNPKWCFGDAN